MLRPSYCKGVSSRKHLSWWAGVRTHFDLCYGRTLHVVPLCRVPRLRGYNGVSTFEREGYRCRTIICVPDRAKILCISQVVLVPDDPSPESSGVIWWNVLYSQILRSSCRCRRKDHSRPSVAVPCTQSIAFFVIANARWRGTS